MNIPDLAGSAFQSFHKGEASDALEQALQLLDYPSVEAEMSHLAAACLHSLSKFDEIKSNKNCLRLAHLFSS